MSAEAEHEQQSSANRKTALDIFLHALGQTTIANAFERHVHVERGTLRVGEDLYDLSGFDRTLVIAIGKAAHAMAEALESRMGAGMSGIVAAPTDPPHQLAGFRYYRGGHPVPNAESLLAARAALRALRQQTPQSLVIYLLSGGGSAVLEQPSDPAISLPDLAATYQALVLSGAPIAQINAIRKHLSAVKGGRMAQAAAPAQQVSILVSDVPDDQLDALASGPTMPDSSTADDCYQIANRYEMLPHFPPSVTHLFEQHALAETPKSSDEAFVRSRWWPVLSNSSALQAAATKAAESGFTVTVDNSCDDWDYAAAADHLLARVRSLRQSGARVCLISGGEVTVRVTGSGSGGRNQQFALYCATKIAGENITVLSAGTDGIDGNSSAAGAVVDGTTVECARARGLSPEAALAAFDAHPLLDALGDTIVTGPSGNNLRDLRILLAS